MSNAGRVKEKVRRTSLQDFPTRLPISQKIMTPTCSLAKYLIKPIPADKIAETMTPARIKVLDESLSSGAASEKTMARVAIAPKKAKSGIENQKGNDMPKIVKMNAREAPKAAPEEIPSVYGSASGLRSIP